MIAEHIGTRIYKLRYAKKMSLPDLADRLGVTAQVIREWESGKESPQIAMLLELAIILEVSLDYLLSGTSVKQQKLFIGSTDPINHYTGETLVDQINEHYLEKGWRVAHTDLSGSERSMFLVVVEK